jgi:sulfite reductase beta subunit-like hemoprotein
VKQEANGRWSVQWRFEDFPKLVPGKYKVRIRARADKKTSGGHGTIVGIYNRAKSTYALKYSVKGTQLDDKKYKWVDCGTAEISAEPMFLYTATAKNSAFKAFYIDAIEFIPTR